MAEGKKIEPGDEVVRLDIQAVWGGALQGGILPAKRSDSILIFSDPAVGEDYGYFDGWLPDDGDGRVFEYTGEGRRDDQEMTRGNKAIYEHVRNGRTLRVFEATGKKRQGVQVFRYLGVFELDPSLPVYERKSPDLEGRERIVYVFRLRPKDGVFIDDAPSRLAEGRTFDEKVAPLDGLRRRTGKPASATVSVRAESERNLHFEGTRTGTESLAFVRREAESVLRFERFLRSKGHDVCRHKIRIWDEPGLMWTDTCDETDLVLYEAKGGATRRHVRDAISQLADYVRHVRPERQRCAVLLPSRPSDDLCELIASQGLALVYEANGTFVGWPVVAE